MKDKPGFPSQVSKLKTLKGLSLQDILAEVHHYVHKLDLPAQVYDQHCLDDHCSMGQVRIHLLIKMAELEARLMAGATEKIQLGSFLAIFQVRSVHFSPGIVNHIWVRFPRTGKMSNMWHFFFIFDALL